MISKIRRRLSRIIYNQAHFEKYFNTPIRFTANGKWDVNERIVEWPFIISQIEEIDKPKKILDFGCTRSWLSLTLASLGHSVYGIDLRDYPFTHKNLTFQTENILLFSASGFDFVISLSTLEHVGLGVYGEDQDLEALPKAVGKINSLLKPGGGFLVTLPVGKSFVDQFERSFTPSEITNMITSKGFTLKKESYFKKIERRSWIPCSRSEISEVSNDSRSGRLWLTGVNGVGCFAFSKTG